MRYSAELSEENKTFKKTLKKQFWHIGNERRKV